MLTSTVLTLLSLSQVLANPTVGEFGKQMTIMACHTHNDDVARQLGSLSDVVVTATEPIEVGNRLLGQRWQLIVRGGRTMTIERIAPRARLRGVQGELNDEKGRPELFFAADHSCALRSVRTMRYDKSGFPVEMIHLGPNLQPTGVVEPVNPPVPLTKIKDRDQIRVAFVDSGVNYLIPDVNSALARSANDKLIGYDYWDMDARPFDAHTPRSAFLIQRHGTRPASLFLREATSAQIVPYRYPRPMMARMKDLIEHASKNDVRIIALPLGSNRAEEWLAFERSVREHPEILFIASAGNNGRNIDHEPIYPAALKLDNLIAVTSADDYGRPANQVNWGPGSVHLLVPAERQIVIDFDGKPKSASGSSYAVSRVAALAARLLSKNKTLNSADLREKIFDLAVVDSSATEFVSVGYIPDPLADTAVVTKTLSRTLFQHALPIKGLTLELNVAALDGSGWHEDKVKSMVRSAIDILAQCNIEVSSAYLHWLRVSPYLIDFHAGSARTLVTRMKLSKPTVFLVRDSRMEIAFEGEAFGYSNSINRPWLSNTVWLVSDIKQPEIALAHELFHVLADSGEHTFGKNNLMREKTHSDSSYLTATQCQRARQFGTSNGLLIKRD